MALFKKKVDGEEVLMRRTHHRWIHPTKGWRQFARPRGTNKRRKLIPVGRIKGSHEYNRRRPSGFRSVKEVLFAKFWKRRRHAA